MPWTYHYIRMYEAFCYCSCSLMIVQYIKWYYVRSQLDILCAHGQLFMYIVCSIDVAITTYNSFHYTSFSNEHHNIPSHVHVVLNTSRDVPIIGHINILRRIALYVLQCIIMNCYELHYTKFYECIALRYIVLHCMLICYRWQLIATDITQLCRYTTKLHKQKLVLCFAGHQIYKCVATYVYLVVFK